MNFLKKQLSSTGSLKQRQPKSYAMDNLLHGHLLIDVIAARDLPDMESWLAKMYDKKDVTDPFVDVRLGNAKLVKTSVILNDLNPEWNESYRVEVCHFADELLFEVRDKDHAYAEDIGMVSMRTEDLVSGQIREGWFPIKTKKGKTHGHLNLKVQFVSKQMSRRPGAEGAYDVDCYFPMQRECRVTLYQDAHCLDTHTQFRSMPPALGHYPRSCWRDLYETLMGAQHIICITGWAVWHRLHLFRGPDRAICDKNLGEILLEKAAAGVKVYVMVWSEKTSGQILGEKGFMGTHDMETYNYFKRTDVTCALAPREIEVNEFTDALQNEFSSGTYTHHQKSVIADAPGLYGPGHGLRRLVAFVGGLDLTGGRWDTPDHQLYSTLLNEHEGDFRNSNAKSVPPEQGPREPWHDIHCKVEGPIAHDVFLNFHERWSKQGVSYGYLDEINTSLIDINCPAPQEDGHRVWNCQLFRSITSDSATFRPEKTNQLNSKKGRMVDASIAQAYIQLIRHAENFIYIENQYFLGSAYNWLQNNDTNCNHTIPCEIAEKIVEKIRANERFVAYIVIPMFPEGDPASAPIQEILYWQYRTMEMMYDRVGKALAEVGSTTHPTDWLLFMCPGKREEPGGDHLNQLEEPEEPMARVFRESMRFPIYVHSKMMIVDDAYVLIGSANVNQRSMAGTRDTEMAVGSWQPTFTPHHPFGDVHRFRMSLWTEHFRHCDELFIYPATMDCVQRVKQLAYVNWQQYNAPSPAGPTNSQMLPYPLNVMEDGRLENLPGIKTFPDFGPGAKIKGQTSAVIPQKVTT